MISAQSLPNTAQTKGFSQPDQRDKQRIAEVFSALGHPSRISILCALLKGEQNVTQICSSTKMEQAPLSQFLSRMRDDGLLISRRQGNRVFYAIANTDLIVLLRHTQDIFCSKASQKRGTPSKKGHTR